MAIYDASLDYWLDSSQESAKSLASADFVNEFQEGVFSGPTLRQTRRDNRNHFLRFVLLNMLI